MILGRDMKPTAAVALRKKETVRKETLLTVGRAGNEVYEKVEKRLCFLMHGSGEKCSDFDCSLVQLCLLSTITACRVP